MEDEEGYTVLTIQARRNASRAASPAEKRDAPRNPRWYQITLWVACFGIVILVAVVIALVLQLEAEKRKTGADSCPVKSNCSLDSFQASLRSRLCNQSQGNSSVNSICQLCSPHWHLHQDKCYWLSKDLKSWNESERDCSEKGAQLAVIQDDEKMEFFEKIAEKLHTYWLGLFISSSEKKWVWITGHEFDQNLLQEPPSFSGNENCGGIKSSKITSDICTAVRRWICQKDPILL
uniref:killer cell lectin-like receptor subfamily B member 1B allele B n=1 Tax=Euleptes europaea TaxID=460621 RepID=UPI00254256FA|nr:killer cell lectin-like receptor subfamily B member 1B allele B [Euleptes europaea]